MEGSAGWWAGGSGWAMGYLTRMLKAMPNQPGRLAVPQQAEVLVRALSSRQGTGLAP